MVHELPQHLVRTLIFAGLVAMVAGVFFSPMLLFLRRRHLRLAHRPPQRNPDAICWINVAIGLYMIHALIQIYLEPR